MMTTAVNALSFSHLSLICRNGTEAVGRLSKSPYLTTTTSPQQNESTVFYRENDCSHSVVKHVRRDQQNREQEPKNIIVRTPASRISNKKRSRTSSVRFAPKIMDDPQLNKIAKKRKRFEPSDSTVWWTKGEIKDIQKSCLFAVQNCQACLSLPLDATSNSIEDNDLGSLDRFTPQNQKRRRLARSQMHETVRAVQAFERATKTKVPPEMLSLLLQRYSTSRVIEATNKGSQTAENCAHASRNSSRMPSSQALNH